MKNLFSLLLAVGLIVGLIATSQFDTTAIIQRDDWQITATLAAIPTGGGAFTIKEFCAQHRISVAFFYVLRNRGEGPVEMHVGSRVLISYEAATDWRRARETAAVAAQKARHQRETHSAEENVAT